MPKGNSGRRGKIDDIKPADDYKKLVSMRFNAIVEAAHEYLEANITEKDLQDFETGLQELTTSEDTHIGIRFKPETLDKVLDDGRFKTQIETGTSNGILNKRKRKMLEHDGMSYSKKTPAKERPIYGMLFNYKKISEADITSNGVSGSHYGGIVAIMKPEIKSYSTVTFGDSFDNYKYIAPSPLLKPARYSCDIYMRTLKESVEKVRNKKSLSLGDFEVNGTYIEAQIHKSRATVSNIQHLIFGNGIKPTAAQIARLKSLGITWSREGSDKIY